MCEILFEAHSRWTEGLGWYRKRPARRAGRVEGLRRNRGRWQYNGLNLV